MKPLKRLKLWTWVLVLLSCAGCGAMAAGVRPALAALSPLAEETCTLTWTPVHRPAGLTLTMDLDCSGLMRLRPIQRLHLSPVDRKW